MADVNSALRTLRIYETFARRRQPLTLSELADELDLPRSSTLLLIRTLLGRGYLFEVSRRGGYYPTRRMLGYATEIAAHDPVVEGLRDRLETLRDASRETVALAKRQGASAIYLVIIDSPEIIRPAVLPGTLRPLHSTSIGKALLSLLAPARRHELLLEAGLPALTERTIIDIAALDADLARSAARGWYANDGETFADLSAVAVALRLNGEDYAISIMGPRQRMAPRLREHGARLLACQEEYSALA